MTIMGVMQTIIPIDDRDFRPFPEARTGRLGLSAVLLLSLFACQAGPAPPSDFVGDWAPVAILERSIQAYGGPEQVLSFQDLFVECELTVLVGSSRQSGKTALKMKPPDLIFCDLR
ncbi:MAG: hypothetical protein KJ645_10480, partial [Planctomycetes bacterium]|nr:hypothetical protein [Planctomycetota bacterium]